MATESTFHLVVASVGDTKFDGPAVSATLPTTAGEITILAHHAPLVATLKKGTLTARKNASEELQFEIESGVLEVSGNRAVVLL